MRRTLATATSGANTARLLRRPWRGDYPRPARLCAVTSTGLAPTSRGPWLRLSTRLRRPTETDATAQIKAASKFESGRNLRDHYQNAPPLGLAHFTVLEVPPLDLVSLAARIGYASMGLRLHPAFPGAPYYTIPVGSSAMREMKERIQGEGVSVYDIEFVIIDPDFAAERLRAMLESAGELGARRLSVCGDDPDRGRLEANFAELCMWPAALAWGSIWSAWPGGRSPAFRRPLGSLRRLGAPMAALLSTPSSRARVGLPAISRPYPATDPQRAALRCAGDATGINGGHHRGGPVQAPPPG